MVVFYFSLDTSFLNLFISFLSSVVVFSIDKHFGEYTLGEIPLTRSFKLDFGRWGKALSVDR